MDLINTLFFYYTKDEVKDKLNGENPTSYYVKFFKLMTNKTDLIKNYVKKRISTSKSIVPSTYEKPKKAGPTESYFVDSILCAHYDPLLWEKEKKISSILFKFKEKDFVWFLSECLFSSEQEKIIRENATLDQDNNVDLDDEDQKKNTPQNTLQSREDNIRGTIETLRISGINKPALQAAFNYFCSIFIKEV